MLYEFPEAEKFRPVKMEVVSWVNEKSYLYLCNYSILHHIAFQGCEWNSSSASSLIWRCAAKNSNSPCPKSQHTILLYVLRSTCPSCATDTSAQGWQQQPRFLPLKESAGPSCERLQDDLGVLLGILFWRWLRTRLEFQVKQSTWTKTRPN